MFAQMQGLGVGAAPGNRGDLMDAVNAEEKRGVSLSYSQDYRSGGRPILFRGTIFTGITAFTANKCGLTIGTTIVDRYSGEINRNMVKNTQNIYNASIGG